MYLVFSLKLKAKPKESRIPVPSFAQQQSRKRKRWNKQGYNKLPEEQQQDIHKMDALNLELSESFKAGEMKQALNKEQKGEFIEKGRLLDSLDLNTGFDAFQKQKEVNPPATPTVKPNIKPQQNKVQKENEVQESDLRDSLDEDDWEKFNDRAESTPQKETKEENKQEDITDDSELDRDEQDDEDWLRQSMQESMSNWKKEINKLEMEMAQKESKPTDQYKNERYLFGFKNQTITK